VQSVVEDRVLAAAVAGSGIAWGSIVDSNMDRMWRTAIGIGLSELDAAQVCELAWLRLSQRLPTFTSLAEVAEWLEQTVQLEAAAMAAQHVLRERQALQANVVRLAPGFALAPRAARSGLAERATTHPNSVRPLVIVPRQSSEPIGGDAADASALPG